MERFNRDHIIAIGKSALFEYIPFALAKVMAEHGANLETITFFQRQISLLINGQVCFTLLQLVLKHVELYYLLKDYAIIKKTFAFAVHKQPCYLS